MKKVFIIAAIFCAAFSANAQAKPADQPKDTAIYYIIGTKDEFQLLYRAIIAPMDVTPNQQKALAGWIERLKPVTPKEADKPKPTK